MIQICISCSQPLLIVLENSFISFRMIVGHFSSSISLWIRLFIFVWLEYGHTSAFLIKTEPRSFFPTLDTLIVSGPFYKIRCCTIWYPVELYPTFMCFTIRGLTTVWQTWSYIGEGILVLHIQQWFCIKLHPSSWALHVLKRGYPCTKTIVSNTFQSIFCIHISYSLLDSRR